VTPAGDRAALCLYLVNTGVDIDHMSPVAEISPSAMQTKSFNLLY
jgi:hypothetical protein